MFDFDSVSDFRLAEYGQARDLDTLAFRVSKRIFDFVMSILLVPIVIVVALSLVVLNPLFNTGPLLFVQKRMGKNCSPFLAFKFRTMLTIGGSKRGPDDPLEVERITVLGHFLRQSRLDELPQIFNVLLGEMSLIGPRPDSYAHAKIYVAKVPGYRDRHTVLPGISGFAQTEVGYVEGLDQTRIKVAADLHYIQNRSCAFEAWLLWRTLVTIASRNGQ